MTRYHSPRELAHALQDAAPLKLGLLFYNEHSPDTTPVWLLRDPYEKPAHHRAKIGVWPWGEDGDQVFVQWCVEKGVAGSAALHFPASDILKPEWAWTPFLERATNKAFDAQLKAAELIAQQPLTVRLTLDTATPGRGRDYQGTKSQDFTWHPQAGRLTDVQVAGEAHFNDRLADASTMRQIALLLPDTEDLDWRWIDFGVGVVLPLRQETLNADEIWKRVLVPWASWL